MTMTVYDILSFSIIAGLLVMSPGPNGALIVKTVPTSGVGAGLANIGGFIAAFYLHGTLSVLGISILIMRSAELFTFVKLLGAAYLIWIGLKALREATQTTSAARPVARPQAPRRRGRSFAEGFLTNALNPKVSLFYLAAFPQFIPHSTNAVAIGFGLVTLHALINAVWFLAVIAFLSRIVSFTRSGAMQRGLKAVTGVAFVGFGLRLALAEQ